MRPARRYCLFLALLLPLALATGAVLFWISFKPAPARITLAGSAETMGQQHGHQLKWRMRLLTRIYLDRIVCRNDARIIEAGRLAALQSLDQWPATYAAELRAMARAGGLEPGALAYGNAFLDLGHVRAGCRSTVIVATGLVLHGHNLDWDNLGGLGRWTTTLIRREPSDGRFRTVAIGFPGMVGALDIVNEHGLALSFNELGIGRPPVTEPVFVSMRRIAETCQSFEEARQLIRSAPAGMPYIITLSHAREGKAAIFERTAAGITERPLQDGWVAAANAAQGLQIGRTLLDQALADRCPSSVPELQALLAHPDVMMGSNIYSVIFDFLHNRLFLASGQIPAAAGPYREFVLFP